MKIKEYINGQRDRSRRRSTILRAWKSIVEYSKTGAVIQGTIIRKTKGGLIVDCNGIETFLPGSQIDIEQIVDHDQYINRIMDFKVVKVNERIKN